MIKNYIKIAIRNIAKNKTQSLINIFGLSIAFLCSVLLFLNAYFELSHDNFYLDKDRLYKIYYHSVGPDGKEDNSSMPYPVASTMKLEIPAIEASTRFMHNESGVEYNGKKIDLNINLVDEDFTKVFKPTVINGNNISPLKDLGNAVITDYAAKRIFGKQDPIGKTLRLTIMNEPREVVVEAVLQDYPDNSSIKFDVLVRTELRSDYATDKNNWNMWNHDVYVKLKESTSTEDVERKMSSIFKAHSGIDSLEMKKQGYVKDQLGNYSSLLLLPITEIHFENEVGTGDSSVSKTYIYTLLLISIFILAIACFNFINLNIARAFTRIKEAGVRKSLGASRKQIFMQVWGESLMICLVSVIIGVLAAVFVFPYFNQLFSAHLSLSFFYKPSSILMIVLSVLVISLCAGGYPAFIISKLSVSGVLRGNVSMKRPGVFRNSLIILQFTIACLLMCCTIIAYKQFNYMREMPLGFSKEALISFPVQGNNGRELLQKFRTRFAAQSSIESITGSSVNLGLGKDFSTSKWTKGFEYKGKDILTNWMTVDYNFLQTAGIKPLKGRDFTTEFSTDKTNGVIVTESMAKQLGINDVGMSFTTGDSSEPGYNVVAIIPDFHLYSLHEKLGPITMDMRSDFPIHYVLVKTKSNNPTQIMNMIEKTYTELQPGKEFKGSFLDENVDRWYQKEKRLSMLLGISSIIAMILSCLGLFALALLMIQQRIKEIGVRKVLGASVANINGLLTKDFLKLVLLAIVIATPIAYWLMNTWLQDFPYRTAISWMVFVVVGISAVLISVLTISFHTVKAAMSNPVKSLRTE